MLPEKEYLIFSKKVSKLLKTCFLRTKHPGEEPFHSMREFGISAVDTSAIGGQCTLTQENSYFLIRKKPKNTKTHYWRSVHRCPN